MLHCQNWEFWEASGWEVIDSSGWGGGLSHSQKPGFKQSIYPLIAAVKKALQQLCVCVRHEQMCLQEDWVLYRQVSLDRHLNHTGGVCFYLISISVDVYQDLLHAHNANVRIVQKGFNLCWLFFHDTMKANRVTPLPSAGGNQERFIKKNKKQSQ